MYLKIRDNSYANQWWYIFDVVRLIESPVWRFDKEREESDPEENDPQFPGVSKKIFIEESCADTFILPNHNAAHKDNNRNDDMIGLQLLKCRLRDNSERNILFDSIAFLCNEDGQTVEKFVVFYPPL